MTLKILVADDSVTIQKIVRLAFSAEDAVVEAVSSGDSALDAVKTFKPDIVLADVNMPGSNGYEVCARIREDTEFSHIPVILLVGTFEPFDEAEASRVGCNQHLTKPFDTEELIQTVFSLAEYPAMFQKNDISETETIRDTSVDDAKGMNQAVKEKSPMPANLRSNIDPRVWDSFVGSERVLDIFDAEILAEIDTQPASARRPAKLNFSNKLEGAKAPLPEGRLLSEDFLERVVDRVVRRMSPDVIREVAWEVVPELSEDIIRRSIKEQNKS
jgi:CheY-like chemotaxis protein